MKYQWKRRIVTWYIRSQIAMMSYKPENQVNRCVECRFRKGTTLFLRKKKRMIMSQSVGGKGLLKKKLNVEPDRNKLNECQLVPKYVTYMKCQVLKSLTVHPLIRRTHTSPRNVVIQVNTIVFQ